MSRSEGVPLMERHPFCVGRFAGPLPGPLHGPAGPAVQDGPPTPGVVQAVASCGYQRSSTVLPSGSRT